MQNDLQKLVGEQSMQEWVAKVLDMPLERVKIVGEFITKELNPKEYKIMAMRYGFAKDGMKHTLEEIGKEIGVTRERIRQIEAKVLCKARAYLMEKE